MNPPLWDSDWSQDTLNLFEPLRTEECCLDNHEGLRNNQNLGQGKMVNFILHMRLLLQDGNGWLFFALFF